MKTRRPLFTIVIALVLAGCRGGEATQATTAPSSWSSSSSASPGAPDWAGAKGGYDAQSHAWFRGMLHPPRVNLALPADFTCVSYSPKGDWNMYDGVIWGDPVTAKPFERRQNKQLKDIARPLFHVRLSADVAQKPGTDTFSNERGIQQSLKKLKSYNVKSQKHHWGPYPVLELTGKRPDGLPFYAAWVGTNTPEGWTLLIDYRVPRGAGHPTADEQAIWDRLMRQSTAQP